MVTHFQLGKNKNWYNKELNELKHNFKGEIDLIYKLEFISLINHFQSVEWFISHVDFNLD